jgi:hypothetical protein
MQPPDLRFRNGVRVIRLFGRGFCALLRLRAHPGAVSCSTACRSGAKGAIERFMVLETAIQGDVGQRRVMDQQPEGGAFQPEPRHVVPGCLADQRLEGALEVRRPVPTLTSCTHLIQGGPLCLDDSCDLRREVILSRQGPIRRQRTCHCKRIENADNRIEPIILTWLI